MATVRDTARAHHKRPRDGQAAAGAVPVGVDGAWTIAAIRREMRADTTAELVERADDLAHVPRLLRSLTWGWLAAVAVELGSRALTAEAAAGKPSPRAGGVR
jgi:hypothetical protein